MMTRSVKNDDQKCKNYADTLYKRKLVANTDRLLRSIVLRLSATF